MDRRETDFALPAIGAVPLSAPSQQRGRLWRVGFLGGASRAAVQSVVSGFPHGMREFGCAKGRTS